MITREMIDRINQLARKSKQDGLSEEEKQEQQELRKKYVEYIKGQVKQQLASIEFVEDKHQHRHEHGPGCGCGHEHHHHEHHHNCNCGCKKH